MEELYQPNYKKISEIYIEKIVFEKDIETKDVTIFGFYETDPFEQTLGRVDYSCDFSHLTDLLLFANSEGDRIVEEITIKLNNFIDEWPSTIDVKEILGKLLYIKNLAITIYKPFEKDENDEWHETESSEEFYILDKVEYNEIKQTNKPKLNPNQLDLINYMNLLENAFSYYLHLKE